MRSLEALHLPHAIGEDMIGPLQELTDRAPPQPVVLDTHGLARGCDMARVEHARSGPADDALAVDRVIARVRDVLEVAPSPALGQLARGLGLTWLEEHAQLEEVTAAAVDQHVRHKPRLSGDLIGERLVDAPRELGQQPGLQTIPPHARKHSLLPSLLPAVRAARNRRADAP